MPHEIMIERFRMRMYTVQSIALSRDIKIDHIILLHLASLLYRWRYRTWPEWHQAFLALDYSC